MRILLLISLLLPIIGLSNPYDWKVVRVVDGDTVTVEANYLPPELGSTMKVRILGVDTPEKAPRAKCEKEAAAGLAASAFVRQTLNKASSVKIEVKDWDKYGGRVLGDVLIDGEKLSSILIKNNLARAYNGGAKKSWCN